MVFVGRHQLTGIDVRRQLYGTRKETAMKDAYGDGNALYAVVIGTGMLYGFIGGIYLVYRIAIWIKG